MASTIKKGDILYIPFINGYQVTDSQGKPRIYKSEESFRRWFPPTQEQVELVRYKPVELGYWVDKGYDDQYEGLYECSICHDERYFGEGNPFDYGANHCMHCGSEMVGIFTYENSVVKTT